MTQDARPLAPGDTARLLESAATAIRAELTALSDDVLGWHPAPGEWCVKEVLGHLIESERRGFAGRIRIILASDTPALEGWDQAEVARSRKDCARPMRGLLDELAALRAESAVLVRGLGAPELKRGGRHPKVGVLSVGDLLQEWVHHDRNHTRQALANVQAFVWPAMGAAQKFSAP